MRRREFSTLLGGAATASTVWPSPLGAQQKATPVIGFLGTTTPGQSAPSVAAFRDGLNETGYAAREELRKGATQINLFASGGVVYKNELPA